MDKCEHVWIELKDGALCAMCDAEENNKGERLNG